MAGGENAKKNDYRSNLNEIKFHAKMGSPGAWCGENGDR